MDLLKDFLGNIQKSFGPLVAAPPAIPPYVAAPKKDPLKEFLGGVAKKAEENKNALLNKSPFLANLRQDTMAGASRLIDRIGAFGNQQVQNVTDAVTGKLPATGGDYWEGTKTVAKGIGRGFQLFNEGTISFGKSLMEGLVGKDVIDQMDEASKADELSSRLLESITGTDDVATAQDILPAVNEYAVSRGATPNQAQVFGGLAFFGLMAANSPGFGPGTAGFRLGKEALDTIAKTEDLSVIAETLAREGMDPETAAKVAPAFQFAETPRQVDGVVRDIQNGVKIVEEAATNDPDLSVRLRERGFGRSAADADPSMGVTPEKYIQRNTDQLAIKAANLVKDDITAAEAKAASRAMSDENVAVASELLKYYSRQAAEATEQAVKDVFDTKYAELTRDISRKLTEAGRYSQAASILGRTTPEGRIRFAMRQIEQNNKDKPERRKQPELTPEKIAEIRTTYEKIEQMPEGFEKAKAFAQAEDQLARELNPAPWYRKVTALWKAGLLTGLRTSGLNIASTAINTGLESLSKIPGAGVDIITSLVTGERKLTASSLLARRIRSYITTGKVDKDGMVEGVQKGWEYLKSGYDERRMRDLTQMSRIDYGKNPVGKALTVYVEAVFRVIGAEDFPFFYGARAASVYDQAIAIAKNSGVKGADRKKFVDDLLANPTDEMLENATADAMTATFSNNTLLGQVGVRLQEIPLLGEIVVPFARTPGAVAMQVINYTPVGPMIEIAKQIKQGRFDQRANSKAWGKGITGTGMMALGYMAYQNGLISLNRPDTERQQELDKLQGQPANSIQANGTWMRAASFGPFGLQMLLGGYLARGMEETGSVSNAVLQTALGVGTTMSEQSMMQGLENFIKAADDPSRFGAAYAEGLIGSVVPTIISDISQGLDPYERETPGILDTFKARVPWMRQGLAPQIDTFGGRIGLPVDEAGTIGGTTKDLLKSMLDFTRSSGAKTSPLIEELERLEKAGFSSTPTKLGDKGGYSVLTPEENTKLFIGTGLLVKQKLEKMIADPRYQALDDEGKKRNIDNFVNKSKDRARAEFVAYLTAGMSEADLKAHLSAYKEAGLLTKTVFEIWKDLR